MQDLTILEAARELGYSKNAVKYQVAKLPLDLVYKDEKQITRLKPAAIKELRRVMGQKQPTNNHETTTQETEQQPANNQQTTTQENALHSALLQTVETLQQQLAAKDRQLEAAEREKAEILARLKDAQHAEQQAHALHAGTMQQAALIETRAGAAVIQQEEAPTAQQETKKRGWRFWLK